MTYEEYRQYMKDFFEKYYAKLSQDEINIKLPLDESTKEMWSDDADPSEEWKKWKLVPSVIKEDELEALEKEIGVKLPLSLRAFLTVYHHYFEEPVGRNSLFKPFEAVKNAWNPMLVKFGYLPFTWDGESYHIRCIKLREMPEEEKCGIYQIEHEILFDFDEDTAAQEEIDKNMKFVSENLLTYLDEILNDRDCDSMYEAAKAAIVKILKEECGITDFDGLVDISNEDPDRLYTALEPIQEQYSLSDDDMEDILDMMEFIL